MLSTERLTMADLDFEIEKKAIDTILVAFSDPQGRLVGRRVTVDYFRTTVLVSGMRLPSYLLATDATGRPARGLEVSSVENGYPDLVLRADPATLFRMPWQAGTVGILGDLELPDGTPVSISPREIMRRQAQRVEGSSLLADVGLEPQFTAFAHLHGEGLRGGFANLDHAGPVGAGHVAFQSAGTEPLLHRVRSEGSLIPVAIEGTVGLPSPGQFEVTLRPGSALAVSDAALVLRAAVKDIAVQEGMCATFMSAYDQDAGTADHVTMSLRGARGGMALADRHGDSGLSQAGKAFIAGQLEHAAELCLLYAPNVNSYRRFATDPFSPSAATWGLDNRTCAIRLVGSDANLRVENRIPGSDANPYLAVAATIAAGLDGIARQADLPSPVAGDGRHTDAQPLPASLKEALDAWTESTWVRETFGADVQDHYARLARLEITALGDAGSLDAERSRYFDGC